MNWGMLRLSGIKGSTVSIVISVNKSFKLRFMLLGSMSFYYRNEGLSRLHKEGVDDSNLNKISILIT
jgi:hypothetical protein